MSLSFAQIQQFKIDGYLVLPSLIDHTELKEIRQLITQHLSDRTLPFELEADVQYPGAPSTEASEGGQTIRRLLMAYQRSPILKSLASNISIVKAINTILDSNQLLLNPNHHNCVMTKLPEYSSETLWHRDTRYWSFNNKYLINAWFALGDELEENGAMSILPGSHRWEVNSDALDENQFLLTQHPDNLDRLKTQRLVNLNAGDILLFSAHCFHAAGRNTTSKPKFSAVFTYHADSTKPNEGSLSAKYTGIALN